MTTDAYHEAIYHGARPGAIRAEIDVEVSHEWDDVPSIGECRFGVLQIVTGEDRGEIQTGYVIYDRLLNRIVDGVYFSHESALDVADSCNTVG